MLRELENLLAEIARQQGLDVPQKTAPQRRREAVSPELMEPEIIEAEAVREVQRRPLVAAVPPGAVFQQPAAAGQAVEQAELQLYEKFDQSLSQLDADAYAEPSKAQQAPDAAAEIVDWFRNPAHVRQAIIMNELLQRPVDRW